MDFLRRIDGTKLKKARGGRTQIEIVRASGKVFSKQQLSAWERGDYRPRDEVVPALLRGLGVEFEDVSSPIKTARPKRKAAEVATA